MPTSHTLTGDLSDVVGTGFPRDSVWVTIKTNLGDNPVFDTAGEQIRFPRHRFALPRNAQFSKSLWSTAALTNPTGYQYGVEVEWPDGAGGTGKKRWFSGWFSLTADKDMSELDYGPMVPPEYYPELTVARDEAVAAKTDAEAAQAAAEAAQAAAEAVGNTNDTIMAGVASDSGSAFSSVLSASQERSRFDANDIGYDVILVAGQSNAVGFGSGLDVTYLDRPDPRIFQFPTTSDTYADEVIGAVDPLFHYKQSVGNVGHAMTFAREYVRRIPQNRKVLLVPTGMGGSGFTTTSVTPPPAGYHAGNPGAGSWDPANGSGDPIDHYAIAIAQANKALALPGANRLVAVLWHQGEADSGHLSTSEYAAKLDSLIAGFRANTTGAASVPFLVGLMLPDYVVDSPSAQLIEAAQVDTPSRVLRTSVYYSRAAAGMQNGDDVHFNAEGQRVLGGEAFEALALAQANVLGEDPLPPGAVTFTQSGTSVTAYWERPVGRVTDYVVESNTGSGWTTATRTPSPDNSQTFTGLTLGNAIQVRVATVNEEGTSAPNTPGIFTLATIPPQVTGVAAGTPIGTTVMPLVWDAVANAERYQIQYREYGTPTWLDGPIVTTNSGKVSGLHADDEWQFKVAAINAAGQGAYSDNVVISTAAVSPLVEEMGVTSAVALWGLRRLHPDAVNAVRVRRSSDNTETDIGFSGDHLDTSALTTFVGAGNGFIKTWYDQSGNGRDLTQTTTANQAKVVNAGAVVVNAGGRPTATFGSPVIYTLAESLMYDRAGASLLAVVTASAVNNTRVVNEGSTTTSATYNILAQAATSAMSMAIQDDGGALLLNGSGPTLGGAMHQVSIVDTGTALTPYIDGSTNGTRPYDRTGKVVTLDRFAVGGRHSGSNYMTGTLSELAIFGVALGDTQRGLGQANQKSYHGTP